MADSFAAAHSQAALISFLELEHVARAMASEYPIEISALRTTSSGSANDLDLLCRVLIAVGVIAAAAAIAASSLSSSSS